MPRKPHLYLSHPPHIEEHVSAVIKGTSGRHLFVEDRQIFDSSRLRDHRGRDSFVRAALPFAGSAGLVEQPSVAELRPRKEFHRLLQRQQPQDAEPVLPQDTDPKWVCQLEVVAHPC